MIQLSHAKLGNLPQVAIHRDVSITKDVVIIIIIRQPLCPVVG